MPARKASSRKTSSKKLFERLRAFTLIELLIVIAIMGILASIVIVAINPISQMGKAQDANRLHYANQLEPSAHTCVSPWTTMYISPTGCVYPCLNYYVGNIREQPFRELWNSERYRQYRKRLLRDGQFPDCVGCCDLFEKRRNSSPLFRLNHDRRPASDCRFQKSEPTRTNDK